MFGIDVTVAIGIGIVFGVFSITTVIAALVVSGREEEYEERRELEIQAESSWG